ncbi:hypothetical protein LWI29_006535 [Acer saccharum]|uniref:Uncharacterized protein n=1 Tax=Acer saccharum TaxID=4024 RepID=A0AA39S2K9_ACESA|nr:hypothetical protein LWI29_006535 [Acer saccharum]
MADHLSSLCQSLFDDKPSSSLHLFHLLRSHDSIKLGLHHFYSLLKTSLRPIGDDDSSLLGFQSWTDQQIQSLLSIGYAIASASRSLTAEQAEPIIIAVVQQLLEFALCYLEKSKFHSDDFTMQNNILQLLEIVLVDGTDRVFEQLELCSVNSLVELLPVVSSDCGVICWMIV